MKSNKLITVMPTLKIDFDLLQKQKQTLIDTFDPWDNKTSHMQGLIELIETIQDIVCDGCDFWCTEDCNNCFNKE